MRLRRALTGRRSMGKRKRERQAAVERWAERVRNLQGVDMTQDPAEVERRLRSNHYNKSKRWQDG